MRPCEWDLGKATGRQGTEPLAECGSGRFPGDENPFYPCMVFGLFFAHRNKKRYVFRYDGTPREENGLFFIPDNLAGATAMTAKPPSRHMPRVDTQRGLVDALSRAGFHPPP
jgi:hypothetical protein